MRDCVDGITEYDPHLCAQYNVDPTSYTGSARFSQGFFDNARLLSYPVTTMIQETYSTRSQEGYAAGVMDCQFAESRARERGWSFSGPIDYVVSDGSGSDSWDASEYGRGISDTMTMGAIGYGANGVLDSFTRGLMAGAGAHLVVLGTDGLPGRHVPETWPGGTNLIGQVVGPSPIPNTDLNHVHADYTTTGDDMAQADIDRINGALFGDSAFGGTNKGLVQQSNEITSILEGNPLYNQKPLADVVAEKVIAGVAGSPGAPSQGVAADAGVIQAAVETALTDTLGSVTFTKKPT